MKVEVVDKYINSHYIPIDSELMKFREISEEENIPIIQREMESFLKVFLALKKPKKILEIGTATGYSAIFFMKFLENSNITTIELNQDRASVAALKFKEFSVSDRVDLINGRAEDILDSIEESFDLIFIDSAKSGYHEIFDKSLAILNLNGYIVCDNVLLKGSVADSSFDKRRRFRTSIDRMRNFLEYIVNNDKFETSILSISDGVSITSLKDLKKGY